MEAHQPIIDAEVIDPPAQHLDRVAAFRPGRPSRPLVRAIMVRHEVLGSPLGKAAGQTAATPSGRLPATTKWGGWSWIIMEEDNHVPQTLGSRLRSSHEPAMIMIEP